jgi:hypothetical protein
VIISKLDGLLVLGHLHRCGDSVFSVTTVHASALSFANESGASSVHDFVVFAVAALSRRLNAAGFLTF